MSKMPACQRLVVNSGGGHVHKLGTDHSTEKRKKLSIGWFHKDTDEQKEHLIPTHHSNQTTRPPSPTAATSTSATFAERYGHCKWIIHYGHASTVRLYRKSPIQVYAVKVFHRSRRNAESDCFTTTGLRHPHIVETVDLVRDDRGDLCLVMEFCAGGDLLSLLLASASGKLERVEADCFFKQLVHGVGYLHENGIAHRNLKPESILLTANGCVKIADFDRAVAASDPPKDTSPLSQYLSSTSTSAYIAPEEYTHRGLDRRTGDIWAAGMIYMAMRTGCLFWSVARRDDARFEDYVKRRAEESFGPIEALEQVSNRIVFHLKS
ncbi:hypothetical protein VTN77DRAFT_5873 [Rasamsonia byssochlamydoides]|uniref:uncharacterized protein n=1 Tax=Rasamsonia byssochlamydoides TaxID=89139 RepID=UPI0037443215